MLDIFVNVFLSIPLVGAFAMFALGIAVIYRASRVLNLAHGAMAMVPAYVFYSLARAGVPIVVDLPLAIVSGALLGVLVERVFVRRLRPQGPTAQTVGTVAVAGLLIALAAKVWGTTPIIAPSVFPQGQFKLAGAAVRFGDVGLFVVGITVSAGLFAFFKFTEIGLAMRGAAQNRRAASLMGIDPDLAAAAAWALGGGLAALAGVLLAAVTNLDPYNLSLEVLPAFVAVLIGGLDSLLGALVGAGIAGLAFGLVPSFARLPLLKDVLKYPGAPQLVLTVLALVVMATRGRKLSGSEGSEAGFAGGGGFRSKGRRQFGPGALVGGALLLLLPVLAPYSILGDALLAMELAIVALSLVVLTGWVGQISLAQASFVGMGALVTAMFGRQLGWSFPLTAIVGAVVGAGTAVILGVVALRVRGLYLAVATLIFAWMADQFLFRSPWLGASGGTSGIGNQRIGRAGAFPSLDLTSRTVLYYLFLAVVILVVGALANLRDAKTGRAFFAVRGSEVAAASLGIDVARMKLLAFAVSGTLAGLGGSLLLTEQRTVVPVQFLFTMSLQYLAIAVVGGLTSLGGALAAGAVFAGLNELFFQVRALAGWLEVVSAGLLGIVLLAYPGGLAAVPEGLRSIFKPAAGLVEKLRILRRPEQPSEGGMATEAKKNDWFAEISKSSAKAFAKAAASLRAALPDSVGERLSRVTRSRAGRSDMPKAKDWYKQAHTVASSDARVAVEAVPSQNGSKSSGKLSLDAFAPVVHELSADRSAREPLIEVENVTVRFGGLTAVNDASLSVRAGEIVGLIGPNGAGKTTLFNSILGLNDPVGGRVRLYGRDVTDLPPHLRARLGIARTFQVIQLFNELSLFDNLLVATHGHNESTVVSNLLGSARSLEAEIEARQRVSEIVHLLNLGEFAHEGVRSLPFGILRMVELARALVTGAQVMMLDEIASGLNEQETDRLIETVRGVRALGVSVLLIEHDVRMVTQISDYVYVLDQGRMIAEGTPDVIVTNERVIEAYLGAAAEVEPVPVGGA
jgi:ABC-type branched-subunit amino acid transport system ATPase component/branched-subunit amino acid ABC-type transport system permease component